MATNISNFQHFMPRLHLPYDEYTMPVGCPNYCFRAAFAGRPCDHRTDLRASWPLRFCLTPHRTVIVRTMQGFRLSFWPKNDCRLLR